MQQKIMFFLVFVYFVCSLTKSISLNTPIVLLPYSSVNDSGVVKFVLFSQPNDSCLKWTVQKENVVELKANSLECSSNVTIIPKLQSLVKSKTIIYAKDVLNDLNLRSDVIVDRIERIEIVTRTRELSVGEMFENIQLYGYDSQGNVFSSLSGLKFKWILKVTDKSPVTRVESILKIVKFKSTTFSTDDEILQLENQGFYGSSIMIQPINSGEVQLDVIFEDEFYSKPLTHNVKLLVRDEIAFDQNHVKEYFMLTGSVLAMSPVRLVYGKFVPIKFPSKQYNLNISDPSVISLIDNTKVFAIKVGKSKVTLNDGYIPSYKENTSIVCNIFVVEPKIMQLNVHEHLFPVENYVFKNKEKYIFDIKLLFQKKNLIIHDTKLLFDVNIHQDVKYNRIRGSKFDNEFSLFFSQEREYLLEVVVYGVYINSLKKEHYFANGNISLSQILYVVDIPTVENRIQYGTQVVSSFNLPIKFDFMIQKLGNFVFKYEKCTMLSNEIITSHNLEIKPCKTSVTFSKNQIKMVPLFGIHQILIYHELNHFINTSVEIRILPVYSIEFNATAIELYQNERFNLFLSVFVLDESKKIKLINGIFDEQLFKLSYKNPENINLVTHKTVDFEFTTLNQGHNDLFATMTLPNEGKISSEKVEIYVYKPILIVKNEPCISYTGIVDSEIKIKLIQGPYELNYMKDLELYFFIQNKFLKIDNYVITKNKELQIGYKCTNKEAFVMKVMIKRRINNNIKSPIESFSEDIHIQCFGIDEIESKDINIWTDSGICKEEYFLANKEYLLKINLFVDSVPVCFLPSGTISASGTKTSLRISQINSYYQNEYKMVPIFENFYGLDSVMFLINFSSGSFKKEQTSNFIVSPYILDIHDVYNMYINEDLQLEIFGGSREMYIQAPESDHNIHHKIAFEQKKSILTVSALNIGTTSVMIKDYCIPNSLLLVKFNVKEPSYIKVEHDQAIMLNKLHNFKIYIFDNENILYTGKLNDFDVSFKSSLNPQIKEVNHDYILGQISSDVDGIFDFIVTVKNKREQIYNYNSKIEVISPLVVFPESINAINKMTYQFNLNGGLIHNPNYEIEAIVEGNNILDLDIVNYLVYTKNNGNTTIIFQSISKDTKKIFSQATLYISCSRLTRTAIKAPKIVQKNTVVHILTEFYNQYGLVSFGILPKDFHFIFSNTNSENQIISSFGISNNIYTDKCESIFISLNKKGNNQVGIKLMIDAGYFWNSLMSTTFSQHTINFEVFDSWPIVDLEKNAFYDHFSPVLLSKLHTDLTEIIFLPSEGAKFKISLNSDNTESLNHFSLYKDGQVFSDVICNGKHLKVDDFSCDSESVEIISNKNTGNSIIKFNNDNFLIVHVKKVFYFVVTLLNPLKSHTSGLEGKFSFPQNYVANFKLFSFDENGHLFSSLSSKDCIIEMTNKNSISVINHLDVNNTFSVIMKKKGSVALKVSSKDVYFVMQFEIEGGFGNSEELYMESYVGNVVHLNVDFYETEDEIKWVANNTKLLRCITCNDVKAEFYSLDSGSVHIFVSTKKSNQQLGRINLLIKEPSQIKYVFTDKSSSNYLSNHDDNKKCISVLPHVDDLRVGNKTTIIDYSPFKCNIATNELIRQLIIKVNYEIDDYHTKCCIRIMGSSPKLGINTLLLRVSYKENYIDVSLKLIEKLELLIVSSDEIYLNRDSDVDFIKVKSHPTHLKHVEVSFNNEMCLTYSTYIDRVEKNILVIKMAHKMTECAYDIVVTIKSNLTGQEIKRKLLYTSSKSLIIDHISTVPVKSNNNYGITIDFSVIIFTIIVTLLTFVLIFILRKKEYFSRSEQVGKSLPVDLIESFMKSVTSVQSETLGSVNRLNDYYRSQSDREKEANKSLGLYN